MQTRRFTGALAALVLGLGLAAACSSGEDVDVGGGGGSGSGGGGGITAAIAAEPDQLDPHKTTAYASFEVLENVYDTLVAPDENLEMQPSLAEEWETSDDQLTWTFHLRDGVTFHDGKKLTAQDVVYSFNRIIDNELSAAYRFDKVKKVSAKDDSTVVLELRSPAPNLLAQIGGYKGTAIVEKSNVESGDITRAPVGTGPFALTDYTSGQSITLEANKDYWNGEPSLASVTFTFVKEPTVALQNLQSGEVQWTDNLPPQQVDGLKDDDTVELGVEPSNDYWYFATNEKRKPFDDPRVRQALSWAIDRGQITEAAKFGLATVNQTAIPQSSDWYHEYAPYEHDPDKARDLLDKAGVEDLSIDFMVTNEYPETVQAAQVMASQLKEVGVKLNIRTEDFATWLDDESAGKFDAFMLGWLGNIDPADFYYDQHHTGGANNYQGFSDEQVDRLLDQGAEESDPEQRKKYYDDAAERIVDLASYTYLYNPDVVQGWSPDLEGYQPRGDRAVRFDQASLAGG